MGRLSDARKRAKQGHSPEGPGGSEGSGWTAKEEPLAFPAEPGEPGTRPRETSSAITLPSSGLAEDVLALPEAARLGPATNPLPEVAPSAPPPAPRAHNVSFFGTPAREERKAAEPSEHLATFFLAREEYGVDVRLVEAIIRVPEITPVPRAPGFIKGVINLRGRIVPVLDLKLKMKLGDVDEKARPARVVVVKVRERLIGLLVDGASQVLRIPVSSIEPAPEEVVEVDANYIRGVAKLEKRLIILLDLAKVLSLELREGGDEEG